MAEDRQTWGRPPHYQTPEEMQSVISDYFENGVKKKTVVVGKPPHQQTVEIEVPTITGLCLHLGFESRQSFYDYEQREGFSYTIKRARMLIEVEYEEQLQQGNTVGAIFALKNFGWKDKTEVEMNANMNTRVLSNDPLGDAGNDSTQEDKQPPQA